MGILWISFALFQQGTILLLEPGVANIIVGLFILIKFGEYFIRFLALLSGLFSLIICIYQLYASFILIKFGITLFIISNLIVYSLLYIVFLYVLYYIFKNSKLFLELQYDKNKID